MSKHPVSEQKPKVEKAEWLINSYCVHQKTHVLMTLEKSVRDVIKNWDAVDYGISAEKFNEDKKAQAEMIATMKRCGYEPKLSGKLKQVEVDGTIQLVLDPDVPKKHLPINGAYYFTFVGS